MFRCSVVNIQKRLERAALQVSLDNFYSLLDEVFTVFTKENALQIGISCGKPLVSTEGEIKI